MHHSNIKIIQVDCHHDRKELRNCEIYKKKSCIKSDFTDLVKSCSDKPKLVRSVIKEARKMSADSMIGISCSWSRSRLSDASLSLDKDSQGSTWNLSRTSLRKTEGSSLVAQSWSRNISASTIELQKWHWMYVIAWPLIWSPFLTHIAHIIS